MGSASCRPDISAERAPHRALRHIRGDRKAAHDARIAAHGSHCRRGSPCSQAPPPGVSCMVGLIARFVAGLAPFRLGIGFRPGSGAQAQAARSPACHNRDRPASFVSWPVSRTGTWKSQHERRRARSRWPGERRPLIEKSLPGISKSTSHLRGWSRTHPGCRDCRTGP